MNGHLYALLTRDGTRELPRRAVLLGDDIRELYASPEHAVECHLVSRVCELLRESRGDEVYSRDVMVLLHRCLYTTDEGAWMALSEDVLCGLMRAEAVKEYFRDRPDDAACFVSRFQDARSMVHSACILRVCLECLGCFSDEAARSFEHSLRSGGGKSFLTTYASHAKGLPSKARSMALESLGSLLVSPQVFDALAVDVFGTLDTMVHAEDIVTILMASPCAAARLVHVVGSRTDTIDRLLALLLKSPVPRRAPYLDALACLVTPEDGAVRAPVLKTLQQCGPGAVFHAGVRVVCALEAPDQLGGLLARALVDTT